MKQFEYRDKYSRIEHYTIGGGKTSFEGSIEIKKKKWYGCENWEPIYFYENDYADNVKNKIEGILKELRS